MTATKSFHLGDILSVTTGILVSPSGFNGVLEVLEWMTRDSGIYTHQVPRICDECTPVLLAQHPQFADIQVPDFGAVRADQVKAQVEEWLARQASQYGERHDVAQLPLGAHKRINPLQEFVELRSGRDGDAR